MYLVELGVGALLSITFGYVGSTYVILYNLLHKAVPVMHLNCK